jgi:hypothetical protein
MLAAVHPAVAVAVGAAIAFSLVALHPAMLVVALMLLGRCRRGLRNGRSSNHQRECGRKNLHRLSPVRISRTFEIQEERRGGGDSASGWMPDRMGSDTATAATAIVVDGITNASGTGIVAAQAIVQSAHIPPSPFLSGAGWPGQWDAAIAIA